ALLVYLARSPRRSRTRDHLIGLLWSDRDEKQARHSLSEALRVFRRVLGDASVRADVDQVGLTADSVSLDCDRFEELCTRGDRAGAMQVAEGLARALREALGASWSGETTRLIERIRDARVGRRVIAAPAAARARAPLVGRAAELAALSAAWRRAQEGAGHGQVVILEG